MLFDVQPKINPWDFRDFLRMMLPEVDDSQIDQTAKAFFLKFTPSDQLPSPFRPDLFLEAGINLSYYEPEGKGEKAVYHFGFYDLNNPDQRGAFTLSVESDQQILSSKKKFEEFLKAKKTELFSQKMAKM
ncbi:hypothetical protein [Dyadobacter fermentans]|jgi:hypothetical protein|uniref:hypothetical protein n=1 Tax=Dyadobacter fermentans TaxID=94254 RepID=UPI001CBAA508|nr:hypothetical protein [Dyadobacter fermentans]MBZ1362898.1 hypothetical protein [Dyadobacter fermentans]